MAGKKLNKEQLQAMKQLIAEYPNLTNRQIGDLIGCSDSTVGAERRGSRNPKQAAKQAAFEAARAAIGAAPPKAAPALPSMEDEPEEAPPAAAMTVEDQARTLAAEIRIQALRKLRMQLTEGQISPDDVLAVLGDRS